MEKLNVNNTSVTARLESRIGHMKAANVSLRLETQKPITKRCHQNNQINFESPPVADSPDQRIPMPESNSMTASESCRLDISWKNSLIWTSSSFVLINVSLYTLRSQRVKNIGSCKQACTRTGSTFSNWRPGSSEIRLTNNTAMKKFQAFLTDKIVAVKNVYDNSYILISWSINHF